MTIKHRQKMYRVQGPDGRWVQKSDSRKIVWVEDEERATFWKKLHHLKCAITEGIFSKEHDPDGYLDGLPLESLSVHEYIVNLEKTRKTFRLTEIDRFYEKEKEVKCKHVCRHGFSSILSEGYDKWCDLCGENL